MLNAMSFRFLRSRGFSPIERRAEIDAYFEGLRQEKPAIWNGRVLLLHHQEFAGGVLRGEYLETDYASFAAWRHWGRPSASVRDCFGAAAVMGRDRAFLLGVMGPHTFNGGKIYFPCGTPDPDDIVDGKVDLSHSIQRELKEETGFDIAEFESEAGLGDGRRRSADRPDQSVAIQ